MKYFFILLICIILVYLLFFYKKKITLYLNKSLLKNRLHVLNTIKHNLSDDKNDIIDIINNYNNTNLSTNVLEHFFLENINTNNTKIHIKNKSLNLYPSNFNYKSDKLLNIENKEHFNNGSNDNKGKIKVTKNEKNIIIKLLNLYNKCNYDISLFNTDKTLDEYNDINNDIKQSNNSSKEIISYLQNDLKQINLFFSKKQQLIYKIIFYYKQLNKIQTIIEYNYFYTTKNNDYYIITLNDNYSFSISTTSLKKVFNKVSNYEHKYSNISIEIHNNHNNKINNLIKLKSDNFTLIIGNKTTQKIEDVHTIDLNYFLSFGPNEHIIMKDDYKLTPDILKLSFDEISNLNVYELNWNESLISSYNYFLKNNINCLYENIKIHITLLKELTINLYSINNTNLKLQLNKSNYPPIVHYIENKLYTVNILINSFKSFYKKVNNKDYVSCSNKETFKNYTEDFSNNTDESIVLFQRPRLVSHQLDTKRLPESLQKLEYIGNLGLPDFIFYIDKDDVPNEIIDKYNKVLNIDIDTIIEELFKKDKNIIDNLNTDGFLKLLEELINEGFDKLPGIVKDLFNKDDTMNLDDITRDFRKGFLFYKFPELCTAVNIILKPSLLNYTSTYNPLKILNTILFYRGIYKSWKNNFKKELKLRKKLILLHYIRTRNELFKYYKVFENNEPKTHDKPEYEQIAFLDYKYKISDDDLNQKIIRETQKSLLGVLRELYDPVLPKSLKDYLSQYMTIGIIEQFKNIGKVFGIFGGKDGKGRQIINFEKYYTMLFNMSEPDFHSKDITIPKLIFNIKLSNIIEIYKNAIDYIEEILNKLNSKEAKIKIINYFNAFIHNPFSFGTLGIIEKYNLKDNPLNTSKVYDKIYNLNHEGTENERQQNIAPEKILNNIVIPDSPTKQNMEAYIETQTPCKLTTEGLENVIIELAKEVFNKVTNVQEYKDFISEETLKDLSNQTKNTENLIESFNPENYKKHSTNPKESLNIATEVTDTITKDLTNITNKSNSIENKKNINKLIEDSNKTKKTIKEVSNKLGLNDYTKDAQNTVSDKVPWISNSINNSKQKSKQAIESSSSKANTVYTNLKSTCGKPCSKGTEFVKDVYKKTNEWSNKGKQAVEDTTVVLANESKNIYDTTNKSFSNFVSRFKVTDGVSGLVKEGTKRVCTDWVEKITLGAIKDVCNSWRTVKTYEPINFTKEQEKEYNKKKLLKEISEFNTNFNKSNSDKCTASCSSDYYIRSYNIKRGLNNSIKYVDHYNRLRDYGSVKSIMDKVKFYKIPVRPDGKRLLYNPHSSNLLPNSDRIYYDIGCYESCSCNEVPITIPKDGKHFCNKITNIPDTIIKERLRNISGIFSPKQYENSLLSNPHTLNNIRIFLKYNTLPSILNDNTNTVSFLVELVNRTKINNIEGAPKVYDIYKIYKELSKSQLGYNNNIIFYLLFSCNTFIDTNNKAIDKEPQYKREIEWTEKDNTLHKLAIKNKNNFKNSINILIEWSGKLILNQHVLSTVHLPILLKINGIDLDNTTFLEKMENICLSRIQRTSFSSIRQLKFHNSCINKTKLGGSEHSKYILGGFLKSIILNIIKKNKKIVNDYKDNNNNNKNSNPFGQWGEDRSDELYSFSFLMANENDKENIIEDLKYDDALYDELIKSSPLEIYNKLIQDIDNDNEDSEHNSYFYKHYIDNELKQTVINTYLSNYIYDNQILIPVSRRNYKSMTNDKLTQESIDDFSKSLNNINKSDKYYNYIDEFNKNILKEGKYRFESVNTHQKICVSNSGKHLYLVNAYNEIYYYPLYGGSNSNNKYIKDYIINETNVEKGIPFHDNIEPYNIIINKFHDIVQKPFNFRDDLGYVNEHINQYRPNRELHRELIESEYLYGYRSNSNEHSKLWTPSTVFIKPISLLIQYKSNFKTSLDQFLNNNYVSKKLIVPERLFYVKIRNDIFNIPLSSFYKNEMHYLINCNLNNIKESNFIFGIHKDTINKDRRPSNYYQKENNLFNELITKNTNIFINGEKVTINTASIKTDNPSTSSYVTIPLNITDYYETSVKPFSVSSLFDTDNLQKMKDLNYLFYRQFNIIKTKSNTIEGISTIPIHTNNGYNSTKYNQHELLSDYNNPYRKNMTSYYNERNLRTLFGRFQSDIEYLNFLEKYKSESNDNNFMENIKNDKVSGDNYKRKIIREYNPHYNFNENKWKWSKLKNTNTFSEYENTYSKFKKNLIFNINNSFENRTYKYITFDCDYNKNSVKIIHSELYDITLFDRNIIPKFPYLVSDFQRSDVTYDKFTECGLGLINNLVNEMFLSIKNNFNLKDVLQYTLTDSEPFIYNHNDVIHSDNEPTVRGWRPIFYRFNVHPNEDINIPNLDIKQIELHEKQDKVIGVFLICFNKSYNMNFLYYCENKYINNDLHDVQTYIKLSNSPINYVKHIHNTNSILISNDSKTYKITFSNEVKPFNLNNSPVFNDSSCTKIDIYNNYIDIITNNSIFTYRDNSLINTKDLSITNNTKNLSNTDNEITNYKKHIDFKRLLIHNSIEINIILDKNNSYISVHNSNKKNNGNTNTKNFDGNKTIEYTDTNTNQHLKINLPLMDNISVSKPDIINKKNNVHYYDIYYTFDNKLYYLQIKIDTFPNIKISKIKSETPLLSKLFNTKNITINENTENDYVNNNTINDYLPNNSNIFGLNNIIHFEDRNWKSKKSIETVFKLNNTKNNNKYDIIHIISLASGWYTLKKLNSKKPIFKLVINKNDDDRPNIQIKNSKNNEIFLKLPTSTYVNNEKDNKYSIKLDAGDSTDTRKIIEPKKTEWSESSKLLRMDKIIFTKNQWKKMDDSETNVLYKLITGKQNIPVNTLFKIKQSKNNKANFYYHNKNITEIIDIFFYTCYKYKYLNMLSQLEKNTEDFTNFSTNSNNKLYNITNNSYIVPHVNIDIIDKIKKNVSIDDNNKLYSIIMFYIMIAKYNSKHKDHALNKLKQYTDKDPYIVRKILSKLIKKELSLIKTLFE